MTVYNNKAEPIASAWILDGNTHYTTPVDPSNIFTEYLPVIDDREDYEQPWHKITKISPLVQKCILIELDKALRECGATTMPAKSFEDPSIFASIDV